MSGMFDQKPDKASRKLARTQKEEKEKRKTRNIAITITSILLLVSAFALLLNSGFIRRNVSVVTIDGVGFTTAEFEYFFNTEYMDYVNFMSQFQGMGGSMPETNRPLSSQLFDIETGQTWADFITEMTLERLRSVVALYNAAKTAGFGITDEQKTNLDNEIEMVRLQAMINGFPSSDSLLQQMYGGGINENAYRKIQEFITIANSYSEFIRDSFEYPTNTLIQYYDENRDEFDVINYRQILIYPEIPNRDDFDSDDDYDTAVMEANDEARTLANSIAEIITDEDSFLEAAKEYREYYSDPDTTLQYNQGSRLEPVFADWLLDEKRLNGDVSVIETEQGSNVLFFISRDDNNYKTTGMRQILILRNDIDPEIFPGGAEDPDFQTAVEYAEMEAHDRAIHVQSLFQSMGSTEEAILTLMTEYSDDNTEGGLYLNITRFPYQGSYFNAMKVVPEIEDWLFDENRTTGDSELIYTSAFGYHLVYFMGLGEPFSQMIADDRLRTNDHNEWLENLPLGEPVKHFAFILVHI